MIEAKHVQRIASRTGIAAEQVSGVLQLLEAGATVPFIAHYRKDASGNLTEAQVESIVDARTAVAVLDRRRQFILDAIAKQGTLTDVLREEIDRVEEETRLEDFYLPYKTPRRTKASMAHEKGLEPLAEFILTQLPGIQNVEAYAQAFVRAEKSVSSVEEALEGAQHILTERIALNAEVRHLVRARMLSDGKISAHPTKNAEGKKTKFEAYYNFAEAVSKIPSHRLFAVLRGVKEGTLRMELEIDDVQLCAAVVAQILKEPGSVYEPIIRQAAKEAYERHLRPALETEVIENLRDRAEREAIRVFRENAQNLLLAPPAGQIPVIGVDPSATGSCAVAVVDSQGHFAEGMNLQIGQSSDGESVEKTLADLVQKYSVQAVAIGNGNGAREAAQFARKALAKLERSQAFAAFVSDAGALVYATSKVGKEEFPQVDVAMRRAISVARRLQDPLKELVKIEPRHIGVGQYQHDVNQRHLREGLHRTLVFCVNTVGADVNTAPPALLRLVSGLSPKVADNLVARRAQNSKFQTRSQLLEVDGITPQVFEQCAAFLRIRGGDHPLDATAIHPEMYPIVEKIAAALGVSLAQLVETPEVLRNFDLAPFPSGVVGQHALEDIRRAILYHGRDIRGRFKVPRFVDGVNSIEDLQEGAVVEGVVTNVTDFGAFVDIGIQQDGLVHLSELANRFVHEPRDVVRVGQIVKVKVIKIEKALPRISLSMKAVAPALERRKRRSSAAKVASSAPGAAKEAAQAHGDGSAQETPKREPREKRGPRVSTKSTPAGRRARTDGKPGARPKGKGLGAPMRAGTGRGEERSINTLLADQLVALRDQLASKT